MYFIGQIVGIAAVITSTFIYQQTSHKRILAIKLITDILWTSHFYMIGSYTAFATTGLAIMREMVFFHNNKKWVRSKICIIVFMMMFLAAGTATWNNIFSIFPIAASMISTYAFWMENADTTKRLVLIQSFAMLLYNSRNLSAAGVFNELLTMASILLYFLKKRLHNRRM